MKKHFYKGSLILVAIMGLSGCGELLMVDDGSGGNNGGLVPPSAGGAGAFAPVSAPVYPPMSNYNPNLIGAAPAAPSQVQNQRVANMTIDRLEIANVPNSIKEQPKFARPEAREDVDTSNVPMLTPDNSIEINAIGMGVAPENTISPSQALALAKRAAIIDAYRQIGEKMYGVRINGQDTVKDMVSQNSTIKTRVQALIKNAEITETTFKDGLCQVNMVVRLDGRIWHKILNQS